MNKFQTIQKVAEDVGIDPSSIQNLIKSGVLQKYKLHGFNRVFIDIEEFNAQIKPATLSDDEPDFDLDRFRVS